MTHYDKVQVRKGCSPIIIYDKGLLTAYQQHIRSVHHIHSVLLDLSVFWGRLGGQRIARIRSRVERAAKSQRRQASCELMVMPSHAAARARLLPRLLRVHSKSNESRESSSSFGEEGSVVSLASSSSLDNSRTCT